MRGGRQRFPALVLVIVMGVLGAGLAGAAGSAAAAEPDYVKYYTVAASYQGKPEDLAEIAGRFLGSSNRAADIYNLNVGRPQPDGGAVTSHTNLRAGWQLVLPWDAVGDGVRHGTLPTTAGAAPPPRVKPGGPDQTAGQKPPAQRLADPGGAKSSPATKTKSKSKPKGSCQASGGSSSQTDWAFLRLAPDQAWAHTRGQGQMVAVVDSGVDANLAPLRGHMAVGADVVSGRGNGGADCLGSGTAMAAIIAAQPAQGSNLVGLAPDATIMPVKVVTNSPRPRPRDEVTAIEVAVAAGATVIALGAYVDVADKGVAKAVANALAHNVVVVVGAAAPGAGGVSAEEAAKGVLRVGAVGVDGQAAAKYQPGAVDVMAPGANVTTLGITGVGATTVSGTQYAVAFAAGEAALVRAAYPNLSAGQVVHRVKVTSDPQGGGQAPDAKHGWGLINPASAVTTVLAEEKTDAPTLAESGSRSHQSGAGQVVVLVLVTVVGAAVVLLVVRVRRLVRTSADEPEDGPVASEPADTDADTAPSGPRKDSHDDRAVAAR
ncbi:S8 family serine peptidase [Actinoplanes sp. NPDC051346]|uniref:S8 family serine peptidase n=1 Tax=Actinoplanes sp. NPDC051346 TaxID=3155048 RepID=UPI0034239618